MLSVLGASLSSGGFWNFTMPEAAWEMCPCSFGTRCTNADLKQFSAMHGCVAISPRSAGARWMFAKLFGCSIKYSNRLVFPANISINALATASRGYSSINTSCGYHSDISKLQLSS